VEEHPVLRRDYHAAAPALAINYGLGETAWGKVRMHSPRWFDLTEPSTVQLVQGSGGRTVTSLQLSCSGGGIWDTIPNDFGSSAWPIHWTTSRAAESGEWFNQLPGL
jgi:hypothetical protein